MITVIAPFTRCCICTDVLHTFSYIILYNGEFPGSDDKAPGFVPGINGKRVIPGSRCIKPSGKPTHIWSIAKLNYEPFHTRRRSWGVENRVGGYCLFRCETYEYVVFPKVVSLFLNLQYATFTAIYHRL